MGLASIPLGCLSIFCSPALLIAPVLGLMAAARGFKLIGRINAGELGDEGKGKALGGAIAGVVGALGTVGLFASVLAVVLLLAITGNL